MGIPALIAGGGALLGGIGSAIIGSGQSAAQLAAAQAARQDSVNQWLKVNVPDPAQQAIELKNFQVTGQLSPQLQTAFTQSQTGLKNLAVDPTSRAAEVQALTQMQNIANEGGMDAQAKQAEAQALNTANANEQGQRGAIVQSFAQQGKGGAGAELAAELQASQGDANQAAASGLSSAASAQQRALQAMTASGQEAATLNNQDYSQAAAAAQAQDAINRFNTQNQQTVANNNVDLTNKAQAANLQNAQNISNQNTGVYNTQETHNKGLLQTQFGDQAQVASGIGNANAGVATQANTNATNTANQWGKIGSAISQGAGALGQAYNNGSSTGTSGVDQSSEDAQDKIDQATD